MSNTSKPPKRLTNRDPCDQSRVQAFDYSHLSPAFSKLAKPAQRALVNNNILTVRALAQWTRDDVAKLHGIGPRVFPLLEAALASEGLVFKPS